MRTLDEVIDEVFGVHGAPKREEFERLVRIDRRRHQYLNAVFGWMRHIPLVGRVAYVWWYSLVDEGLDGAVDTMCFAFLDDVNPTARWHSWYQG